MSAPNKNYDPKAVASLAPEQVARALDEALTAVAAASNLDELKAARIAHEGDRAPAQPDRGGRGQSGCRQRRPRGRFVIGREVENDAGAEGDREPGKQSAGADLGRGPDAHARRHGKAELRPDAVPAPLHTARRPRSDTGTRGSACTGLCRP